MTGRAGAAPINGASTPGDSDPAFAAVATASSHATYVPAPRSPADARAEVRAFCAAHGMRHLVDDAVLIASELVTNACRVALATVTLALVDDDGALLVVVGDDCPDPLPVAGDRFAQRGSLEGTAESGRGLLVMSELAAT